MTEVEAFCLSERIVEIIRGCHKDEWNIETTLLLVQYTLAILQDLDKISEVNGGEILDLVPQLVEIEDDDEVYQKVLEIMRREVKIPKKK